MTGPWGAGNGQARPGALSLIREPFLIWHHRADSSRQAVCPHDGLVLAAWDK